MELKTVIRKFCPNYLPLRKLVARVKIWQTTRYIIKRSDIVYGEQNENAKKSVNVKYARKWPKYVDECKKNINAVINQGQADSTMTEDMLFCRLAYGFTPKEYLSFGLHDKSMEEREEYISNLDRLCYDFQMNDMIDYELFKDKSLAYKKFAPYYKRDAVCINSMEDFDEFESFIETHPIFVKKRVDLSWGESVELIDLTKTDFQKTELFERFLSDGKCILEEKIIQGKETAFLNGSSVNTVRCATFNTKNGVEIGFCFIRIGQGGAFVDNGSAGGIEVGVDVTSGLLNTCGYDHYGREYRKHPETGIEFNGYQLPCWSQMIDMCKEMAMQLPSIKFVGWDMAYSNKGWCVVEGNATAQMMGPQICYKKGMKNEIQALMNKMDLMV